jgi:hypothetical protein
MAGPSGGSDAHERRVYELCPKLECLFKVAWPKAEEHPTASDCLNIAYKLFNVKEAPRPRKVNTTALKHGRLLMQHLPSLRSAWEAAAQLQTVRVEDREYIRDQLALDNCLSVLKIIEKTEQGMTAFLEACAPLQQSLPNNAAYIADAVEMTWHGVDGARVPKAKGPRDPLCHFVSEALSLIGKPLSRSTVSDMLRNRHHRPRKSSQPRLKKARG